MKKSKAFFISLGSMTFVAIMAAYIFRFEPSGVASPANMGAGIASLIFLSLSYIVLILFGTITALLSRKKNPDVTSGLIWGIISTIIIYLIYLILL